MKTDVPALPDYAVQAFPCTTATITAASLKSGAYKTPKQPTAPDASTNGTLQVAPGAKAPANGMIMKPKNTSVERSSSAEQTPQAAGDKVMGLGDDKYIVVEAGDTLGSLAKELYGDTKQFRKLFDANRDHLRNPSDLVAGMLLKVPE